MRRKEKGNCKTARDSARIIVPDAGNSIILKPMTEQYLRKLQGSLKGKGGLKELLSERREDKQKE